MVSCTRKKITDNDRAGSIDDRKSTFGYVFCLGTKYIIWCSQKQSTVALFSAEAEYISEARAPCKGVWLCQILEDIQHKEGTPTTLFCDMSAIVQYPRIQYSAVIPSILSYVIILFESSLQKDKLICNFAELMNKLWISSRNPSLQKNLSFSEIKWKLQIKRGC